MSPRRASALAAIRSITVATLLLLPSCTRPPQDPPTDPPDPADGPPVVEAELPAVDAGSKLRGSEVEVATTGPWTVRTTRSGGAGRGGLRGVWKGEAGARPEAPLAPLDGTDGAAHPDAIDETLALGGATAGPGGGAGGALRRRELAASSSPRGAAPRSPPTPLPAGVDSLRLDSAGEEGAEEVELDASSEHEARKPEEAPVRTAPLRAGSTDDNAEFDAFVAYLSQNLENQSISERWAPVDVRDRRHVRVVNGTGNPIPAAEVVILDEAADRVIAVGTTYGDGRIAVYPRVTEGWPTAPTAPAGSEAGPLLVQVRDPAAGWVHRARWDGASPELTVTVEEAALPGPEVELDVVFCIDTTGSMGDEIAQIKSTLLTVTEKLRHLEREFDLRYGAVLYRDIGDEYVTKAHPFTSDIEAFDGALREVVANGGGDGPESLNQGLAVAVGDMEWRQGAARVVFLIADAPPHMDYEGDLPYSESVRGATARGVRVHCVAASGLDAVGTLVFRQIAQFTRGQFIFIEYGGSTSRTAASHGVTGKVESNNLSDIIYERIRDEIAGWGRED